MKKIIFILLVFVASLNHAQLTIKSNEVETFYTQAIDARFSGDFSKSRHILENLKENNFTNEYVMSLLIEVYSEYVADLIQRQDTNLLKTAYPGIRDNIAKIWDLFPDSSTIQDNSLKIAWMVGDKEMGMVMSDLVLKQDISNLMANYFAGLYRFTASTYAHSIAYFKRAAYAPLEQGKEQFSFQSRVYLGDIYLEQQSKVKALEYYHKALELTSTPELIAKLAVLETYRMNYVDAISFFQNIPVAIMTPELFNTYILALWEEGSPESITIMNYFLSQNNINPKFAQAIIQIQLGRTQRALRLLDEDKFVKKELPLNYNLIKLAWLKRVGQTEEQYQVKANIGKAAYDANKYSLAKEYLLPLSRKFDTNGDIAYILARISRENINSKQTIKYYEESLSKNKTLYTYSELIEENLLLKNFDRVTTLMQEVQQNVTIDTNWLLFMDAYIDFMKEDYTSAEQKTITMSKILSQNNLVNNLLASIYNKQEKYDEMEELLTNQLKYDPSDIITKNHLAYHYATVNKNTDQALQLALAVVEEKPEELVYLDTLAWVYTIKNDLKSAQQIFSTIEKKLNPEDSSPSILDIYIHLGYFYRKIENLQKSELYFDKAFKINKEDKYLNKIYNKNL
ncbi:MAG: tetratricopeptide repeat protein [Spirochaetota bacterium]|nr:tetratricopeptide repeat protein [Spirochaetota bacterium]